MFDEEKAREALRHFYFMGSPEKWQHALEYMKEYIGAKPDREVAEWEYSNAANEYIVEWDDENPLRPRDEEYEEIDSDDPNYPHMSYMDYGIDPISDGPPNYS